MGKPANKTEYNEIRRQRYLEQKAKAPVPVPAPAPVKAKAKTAGRATRSLDQRIKSERATKRLKGILKIHGASDAEVEKVLVKRAATWPVPPSIPVPDEDDVPAKKAKAKPKGRAPREAKALTPNINGPVLEPKTMGKSYQRGGGVASGIIIKGGGVQATITFTPEQFGYISRAAAKAGVSTAEQVRRMTNVAIEHTDG